MSGVQRHKTFTKEIKSQIEGRESAQVRKLHTSFSSHEIRKILHNFVATKCSTKLKNKLRKKKILQEEQQKHCSFEYKKGEMN